MVKNVVALMVKNQTVLVNAVVVQKKMPAVSVVELKPTQITVVMTAKKPGMVIPVAWM